ncbi:MAG: flavodoxin-dependent (E)-4-hydroxy-3-methylbut-2-enyl-diphosphate synthase [Deferribacteraceae bacterium]|jgi:(E)-4-hydroxy-3-methylbut-2-enyl-diphosphate synthase|nr:flavodoxin-dependent (E)-4-hydroxy-3-methylbut-2-enyl-diphosphate synthase [Deferribacteraceae bacterium]
MSKVIQVGNISIGGNNPIRVQSMCNTNTRDVVSTVAQIKRLEALGCEIIRVAVPDSVAAEAISSIIPQITIPLIADIHFDYKLAIEAMQNGAAAVRINPGNIGGRENTCKVLEVAADMGRAVRVGVNSGSLERDLLSAHGVTAEALVKSALRQLEILESVNFSNYKVSIKASSVPLTVEAYKLFTKHSDAPLHVGVTEAGTKRMGTIKSAVGIGALLLQGIGDTIRVSLTAEPEEEIHAAWGILTAAGVRKRGVEIISCPTCGRTEIDLIALAERVEALCDTVHREITVAVMGCVVNGPGEAKEADYGVAGGRGVGLLFRKGEIVKKVNENELLSELMKMINADQ